MTRRQFALIQHYANKAQRRLVVWYYVYKRPLMAYASAMQVLPTAPVINYNRTPKWEFYDKFLDYDAAIEAMEALEAIQDVEVSIASKEVYYP